MLALRLGGALAGKWRARRRPELAAWSAALVAYAIAAGALAWGTQLGGASLRFASTTCSAGCSRQRCSVWGPRLLYGWRWTLYPGLVYVGLAVGVAIAAPIHGDISGTSIPEAQEHLGFLPARLVAILGNSIGTIAVIGVALATIRRRPLGNVLIITGVAVAALGSAFAGLGAAESAVFVAIAAPSLQVLQPVLVRGANESLPSRVSTESI